MTQPVRTVVVAALIAAALCAAPPAGADRAVSAPGSPEPPAEAGRAASAPAHSEVFRTPLPPEVVDDPTPASRGDLPSRRRRLCPRPPSDLPLDHWAYPLLERLTAREIVKLDMSTLPLSREAIAEAVASALSPCGAPPPAATERERWALFLLEDEFLGGLVDGPLVSLSGGRSLVALGLRLGTEGRGGEEGDPDISMDVAYDLWGGAGRDLGFYADTTILLEGQNGPRAERLSGRTRTWRGIAVAADRAYVKYERGALAVTVGRRGVAWGRSDHGRLLLSGTAPTLDGVEVRFRVGPLTLQGLQTFLDRPYSDDVSEEDPTQQQVFLAAHRAVVAGDWGSVAVAEAVVYSGDLPDPAYLNPFLPYYVSQHNERADDNVLWSLDFVGRPRAGVETWGEFVVDDLQYDRDTGHPDKYGITLGAGWYGELAEGDFELSAEYTNVRKWTYTHPTEEHSFTQDGRPLGFELGPDADRAMATFVYHPAPPWSVTTTYSFTRKGEGDTETPFVVGEDDEPSFPSGNVMRRSSVRTALGYEDPGGLSAEVGAGFTSSRSDTVDDESYEFWARVDLRL